MKIRNANKALLIHWILMKRIFRNLGILIIIYSNKWLGRWKNMYLENEQKVWSVTPKQTGRKWNKSIKKGVTSQPRAGLGKDEEPSSSAYRLKGLICSFEVNKICDFPWFTFYLRKEMCNICVLDYSLLTPLGIPLFELIPGSQPRDLQPVISYTAQFTLDALKILRCEMLQV